MRVDALFRDGVGWGNTRRLQLHEPHLSRVVHQRPLLVTVSARPKARIILAVRATATPLASATVRRVSPDLIRIAAAVAGLFN